MSIRTRTLFSRWFVLLVVIAISGCQYSPKLREAKYLKRGELFLANRDYSRALLEFRNAASVMPGDAEPYYQMGLASMASGDLAGAVRSFRKATSLNPKHSAAQLKLAKLMADSRDEKYIAEAVSRLQSAFGESPDNPEAINTLALAEWELGKPLEAVRRLDGALKKFPTHLDSSVTLTRIKLSARDGREQGILKNAVAAAPRSSAAALALGELYLALGQAAKAESELQRSIQLDSTNGNALIRLGAIQIAAKRMDEAEQTYKRLSALPGRANKPLHAIFLYQFGKREAALAEFEALAKADPTDRDARTRLVAALIGMNRVGPAENLLAATLKRNPNDVDALLQRARLRLRTGRTDDLENDLKQVLHFSPGSVDAHFALAMVYRAKGLTHDEQHELEQSLQLAPRLLQARLALENSFLSTKQAKAALETIDGAPDDQKKQLSWMIGRNWALLSLANWRDAKAGIDRVLQDGRPTEAVYQNAVLQVLGKDYAGARASAEELLKRNVTDASVAELLMQTYAARQETPKGLDRLKDLVAKHPDSAPLHQLLGQWLQRSENLSGARQAFESAKAADPHFASADLALAELDLHEGRNGPARQKLDSIILTDPGNVAARLLLARVQNESGDRVAEIETYRAIISRDPSNLVALNNLAYQLAANSPDEALRLAEQAAELAPDEPSVQDTLGWVYYRKGLYSMAVRCLKTAVEKEPNTPAAISPGNVLLKNRRSVNGAETCNGRATEGS